MKLNFSILLVAIGFAISLFSCTDHRLGGDLSPARLRLKTVQSGTAVTSYTYDNQNRLSTISKPDGSLGVIAYGDPTHKYVDAVNDTRTLYIKYPNSADQTTGQITLYPTNLDGTTFQAATYALVASKADFGQTKGTLSYGFDTNKHLSVVYVGVAPSILIYNYSYTGENITGGKYTSDRVNLGTYTYTYDDKINPFFGLLDPDADYLLRFTRNNPLSGVNVEGIYSNFSYAYEYNQQGLPTKRTTTTQNGSVTEVITYTYESY